MFRRIPVYGLLGLAVAGGLALIGMFAGPDFNLGRSGLAAVLAPASLLGHKIPLRLELFIFLNGCLYALLGLAIESMRRLHRLS